MRSTNASTSTQYALIAIAAVVLGGTSLAGGRGGLIGVAFGAFTIYLFQNLLSSFEVNPAWLQIVYGAILIVAVVIQGALVPEARDRRPEGQAHAGAPPPPATGDGPRAVDPGGRSRRRRRGGHRRAGRDEAVPSRRRGTTLVGIQQRVPLIQLVALVAVFIFGVITLPGLGSWVSIRSILVLAALIGLASCGQTLLILMGGFDLSVSGFIVAGGLTVTALNLKYGIDFATALALALVGRPRCSAASPATSATASGSTRSS